MDVLLETKIPLKLWKRGKVRDIYEIGDNLLFIATDRISAFDVVFPTGIPHKGKCLNQLSLFWFNKMKDVINNHILESDFEKFPQEARFDELRNRSIIVKKSEPLPVECVIRGYLAGSGWRSYKKTGEICGIKLPKGLKEAEKFEEPLFTPSTKATSGHDENISMEQLEAIVGKETAKELKEKSIEIYLKASEYAEKRGIIIADTKFEFGRVDGELILIDELLTPDSSRFWPMDRYELGTAPESLDKEYLRQYLLKSSWNREPPAPELPEEVVSETSRRYLDIYKRLTGRELDV
ncbi:MAG: phosphoribosylaminoimidazolesuccinocarboxamide synthase [Candidatus Diapherotrites archaeon]|nr:phosphoribosylaminoimidazolesuccinocarboxamide synthase [Candidatus Diapherotrites archaeon]